MLGAYQPLRHYEAIVDMSLVLSSGLDTISNDIDSAICGIQTHAQDLYPGI
jgi:hypothetical protein